VCARAHHETRHHTTHTASIVIGGSELIPSATVRLSGYMTVFDVLLSRMSCVSNVRAKGNLGRSRT